MRVPWQPAQTVPGASVAASNDCRLVPPGTLGMGVWFASGGGGGTLLHSRCSLRCTPRLMGRGL